MNIACTIDEIIQTFGYPTIQKENNCGKWMVMSFHKGVKKGEATRVELVKLCLDEKRYNELTKSKKKVEKAYVKEIKEKKAAADEADLAAAKEAAGEEKETDVEVKAEDATIVFQNYDKDAKDSDDLNKRVHKAFEEALIAAYNASNKQPVFGIVELWHKMVFISYIPDDMPDSKLKMPAAGARKNVKKALGESTFHGDIEANCAGDVEYDEFTKYKPNH